MSFSGITVEEVVTCWQVEVNKLRTAVGWQRTQLHIRKTSSCAASMAFEAPLDAVLSATELNTTAWKHTVNRLSGEDVEGFAKVVAKLKVKIKLESDPALLKLIETAREHDIQLLYDDEVLTLGLGTGSQSWSAAQLPLPEDLDWKGLYDVPVALITGTNGKSTTGRMLAAIVRAAGKIPGLTSTDGIQVGDEILDVGDYSGPGGARAILRDKRVDFGVLESARGGMLRRGLGVTKAQAGIITNVAEEHLGEYGVWSLDDLIAVKFTILRPLEESGGTLVLNADDTGLVEYANNLKHPLCWFSLDTDSSILRDHRKIGGPVCYADQGKIYYQQQNSVQFILNVNEIPITLNGAARYNTANALGVIALAKNLGFSNKIIATALRKFKGDLQDNPGRGNYLTLPIPQLNRSQNSTAEQTFQVLIDFAHNEHGLSAVCDTLTNLQAKRRLVVAGHVGSHSDKEIREMTRVVAQIKPEYFFVPEMQEYLRGRHSGEISKLVFDELLQLGFTVEKLGTTETCLEAVQLAIEKVQAGDLLLLVGLDERKEIIAYLEDLKK